MLWKLPVRAERRSGVYGLQPVDSDLHALPVHQSLLKAYESSAKAAFLWAKIKSNSLTQCRLND